MKTKVILTLTLLFLVTGVFSQTIKLIFTAVDNTARIQLDSIKVMNRTQEGDTVLFWPDTVLLLGSSLGMPEINNGAGNFQIFQNYPNPVTDQTTISIFVPKKDKVGMMITDMLGRVILKTDRVLGKGYHSFRFEPGSGKLFFFTAQWRDRSSSIKILQTVSRSGGANSLKYIGSDDLPQQLKSTADIEGFHFNPGDELLYIGYASAQQSGMLNFPNSNKTYILQFANNITCPGIPTVTYDGQVYNTVQIFNQCWLKENMNIGIMIDGSQDMTDNGIIEKKCYDNMVGNCEEFGGLYQWDEMMQYSTTPGVQGICPAGWHVATGEEWKILEGAVDSQYGIGAIMWDQVNIYRGVDAGSNLKSITGWANNGNGSDLYDFSALPGGSCYLEGYFAGIESNSTWWTSTEYFAENAWARGIMDLNQGINQSALPFKAYGFSVRCLKD